MSKGVLICFTGIDGSGKTTIANLCKDRLTGSGVSVEYLWSGWRAFAAPPFKQVASFARKITGNKKDHKTSLVDPPVPAKYNDLLFYPIWVDYVLSTYFRLNKALKHHDVVITDRYIFDLVVGFSKTSEQLPAKIRKTLKYFRIFPEPAAIYFIDVPVDLAFSRKDDVPSIEYLSQLKTAYLELFNQYEGNVIILDGTLSREELTNRVYEASAGLVR